MFLCLSLRQNIFSYVEDILINLLLLRLTVACLLKISLEHLLSIFNSRRLVTKEQQFFIGRLTIEVRKLAASSYVTLLFCESLESMVSVWRRE